MVPTRFIGNGTRICVMSNGTNKFHIKMVPRMFHIKLYPKMFHMKWYPKCFILITPLLKCLILYSIEPKCLIKFPALHPNSGYYIDSALPVWSSCRVAAVDGRTVSQANYAPSQGRVL